MKIKSIGVCFGLVVSALMTGYSQQIPLNTLPFTADIQCTYRFTYQPDSLNKMSTVSEAAFLFIGKRESEYTTKRNLQMDSTKRMVLAQMQMNRNGVLSVARLPVTPINYRIYKDYDRKIMTTVDRIDIQNFRYSESNSALTWHILPQQQAIAGYACQKAWVACGGRRYEAWFTNEIPIPDGPYKFAGLPGLIVRLADTRSYYSFELVAVQRLVKPLTVQGFMGNVQDISRAQFWQAWLNYQANPFAAMESEGMTITEEDRVRRRERAKRRNNTLELR